MGSHMSNTNLNLLGSNQHIPIGQSQRRNWSKGGAQNARLEYGLMDLVSEEENDPIIPVGSNIGNGSLDLSASSGEQSSRAQ